LPALRSVYSGIDVACATDKALPICFAEISDGRLVPLAVPPADAQRVPRGLGNGEIRNEEPFASTARRVAGAVLEICEQSGWRLGRIAIDAPAAPPMAEPRACEQCLRNAGLSVFQTPSCKKWTKIIATCRGHLDAGGSLARLPYANKIWMLYGFRLFAEFRARTSAEVIEVYPYAIAHRLNAAHRHKSTTIGYENQLKAVAKRTGWSPAELERQLTKMVPGNRHDRLDAFMAAWVASLPPEYRSPYGTPAQPDDVIWVPA
jgi:predicted nuclease with RNAse H fold